MGEAQYLQKTTCFDGKRTLMECLENSFGYAEEKKKRCMGLKKIRPTSTGLPNTIKRAINTWGRVKNELGASPRKNRVG